MERKFINGEWVVIINLIIEDEIHYVKTNQSIYSKVKIVYTEGIEKPLKDCLLYVLEKDLITHNKSKDGLVHISKIYKIKNK